MNCYFIACGVFIICCLSSISPDCTYIKKMILVSRRTAGKICYPFYTERILFAL